MTDDKRPAEKTVADEIRDQIIDLQGTEPDDVAAHSASGGDTHSTYSVAVCTGTKA